MSYEKQYRGISNLAGFMAVLCHATFDRTARARMDEGISSAPHGGHQFSLSTLASSSDDTASIAESDSVASGDSTPPPGQERKCEDERIEGLYRSISDLSKLDRQEHAHFTPEDYYYLLEKVSPLLLEENMCKDVKGPVIIVGDIHGQLFDLCNILKAHKGIHDDSPNFIFLGDYVDRGGYSLEVISLLMCLKIKYPNKVTLLRGNHETASCNSRYGFYNDCTNVLGAGEGTRVWTAFNAAFNCMSVAAVVDNKVLCLHGGLTQHAQKLDVIRSIIKPCEVSSHEALQGIVWNDPSNKYPGWSQGVRGSGSKKFGADIVKKFLEDNDLDLIVRAHEVMSNGYGYCFRRQLVTVFSAPHYADRNDNLASTMHIDERGNLKMTVFVKTFLPDRKLSEEDVKTSELESMQPTDIYGTADESFQATPTQATTANTAKTLSEAHSAGSSRSIISSGA
eukprot:GHVO01045276.1.p1 GENE.GHVO01045276.1~~GHVO01045276.1.p1  ORF type:complete len:452 (+),score=73.45 GHVO01045276.1:140-1495(+)